jgi:hypothetical protein
MNGQWGDSERLRALLAQQQGEGATLADLLHGQGQGDGQAAMAPMQLAAGGISFQTQRALNELDRESAGAPSTPTPSGYATGRDDRITQEWRERQRPRQQENGVQGLMRLRGWTREQAERALGRG